MGKISELIPESFSTSLLDDRNILDLIAAVRQGISYSSFSSLVKESPFSLLEWSGFLHLSDRTMQRYKSEKKTFDPVHSEKILEITLLYKRGTEVFGNLDGFAIWLDTKSVALGGIVPKTLLDTSFGIGMLQNELTRIEHGVLA